MGQAKQSSSLLGGVKLDVLVHRVCAITLCNSFSMSQFCNHFGTSRLCNSLPYIVRTYIMAWGTNTCLKHLVLGPYFRDQSQSRSQGLGMRVAVSWRKLSAWSALSMPPAFSVFPLAVENQLEEATARIGMGSWTGIGSLATQGLHRSDVKCAVVCWFSCSL